MADPLKLVLGGAIALTLAWGGYELQRDNRTLPPEPQADPAEVANTKVEVAQRIFAPLDEYTATRERPLFYADRKLPQEAQETAEEPQQKTPPRLPSFRLSAVVIENDQATALVETGEGETLHLEQGQSVSGWRLDRVEDTAIVMQSGRQRHRIELLKFEQPPPLQQAAQANPRRPERRPRVNRRSRRGMLAPVEPQPPKSPGAGLDE